MAKPTITFWKVLIILLVPAVITGLIYWYYIQYDSCNISAAEYMVVLPPDGLPDDETVYHY